MRPLLFVNWHQVSHRFTVLMWLVAAALALVVLIHAVGDAASAPAAPHPALFRGAGLSPPALHPRP